MDEMHETLKENELLARKFDRIGKRIAGVASPVGLFELLLTEIEREFSVPFVWISLIADGPLAGIIGTLRVSPFLKDRINVIDEAPFLKLTGQDKRPVLANSDLYPFNGLQPNTIKYFFKSIAVAPLTVHGAIAGSLNLGGHSARRYRPGMDTDLLQRLVDSVSSSLSAMVAPSGDCLLPDGAGAGNTDQI